MSEVDGDAQIGIAQRGYGSEIATFGEEGVISLLSGNLMDVCPVGAITTRDYRFKSRPWDNPMAVDTICTLCEKGCNTTAWIKAKPEWAKGAQLVRMTPRLNPDVNSYWMCDIGRFDYHWVEGDRRLRQPHVRRGTSNDAAPWADALMAVKDAVDAAGGPASTFFLVSAHASLEELFVLREIAGKHRRRHAELALPGEAAAAEHQIQDSRPSMPRTCAARAISGSTSARAAAWPTCPR